MDWSSSVTSLHLNRHLACSSLPLSGESMGPSSRKLSGDATMSGVAPWLFRVYKGLSGMIKLPILGGDQTMRMQGKFEVFPLNSALFGLVM